jgi:5'/3'-nucleotidase SurE
MRILVTNDDGVDAPGILVLAGALADDGHDVFVVAPSTDRSGSGAALGQFWGDEPPPVTSVQWPSRPDLPVFSIDAPPGTAVLAAALGGFGEPPDLVLAGINPGANTGLSSCTRAPSAPLTASGSTSQIAVSLTWGADGPYHWETAAAIAVAAVEWAAKRTAVPPAQHQRAEPPARRARGCAGVGARTHGEVWIASADVSTGDLKLDFKPAVTPHPVPTSACCRPATSRSRR